jgi:hypothetical protein
MNRIVPMALLIGLLELPFFADSVPRAKPQAGGDPGAYLKAGNQESAISNHEKSWQLNPKNQNGAEQLQKLRKESAAAAVLSIPEPDLLPEGITYDPPTRTFFFSSIQKSKIVSLTSDGRYGDFIQSGQDGLLRSLGLKVDATRRRLWAVSNSGFDAQAISAVHVFDLDTRRLVKKFLMTTDPPHNFNDLVLTPAGGAYISDFSRHRLYRVTDDLQTLELFLGSCPLLAGPNGLAWGADPAILYVGSNDNGIMRIDLRTHEISSMVNRTTADTRGADGLLFFRGSLVAVLSSDPDYHNHRIIRYRLSGDGREIVAATVIDGPNPGFFGLTTAVIVEDTLFCLTATGVHLFGTVASAADPRLKIPRVSKYQLTR